VAVLLGHVVEDEAEASEVVADAPGRIEVDAFEGAEEGPAQPEALADNLVDVSGRDDDAVEAAQHLDHQRGLQPVQDEVRLLEADQHGCLP
jgi:hypothetical protein